MFLFRYFREFAALAGVSYFSVNNEPRNGHGWKTFSGDFIACPLRLQSNAHFVCGSGLNMVHLRDPIDVLISQYFSRGWIHPPTMFPGFAALRQEIQRKVIDDYCMEESANLGSRYRQLMAVYHTIPNCLPSSYSMMRKSFKSWNGYICHAILGDVQSPIERSLYANFAHEFGILRRLLIRPASPRAVMSGRFKSHRRDGCDDQKSRYLSPRTVEWLECDLRDVLEFFAYFQTECRAKAADAA